MIFTLSCFQTKRRNNKAKADNCAHTGVCKRADKKPCDTKEASQRDSSQLCASSSCCLMAQTAQKDTELYWKGSNPQTP